MSITLEDLMLRKDEVVEAHNDAINDLEQKYFSDVTQLYRIKQAMQTQLQRSLMDSLREINSMIQQKMGNNSNSNTNNGHSLSHARPVIKSINHIPHVSQPSVSLQQSIDAILHSRNGNGTHSNNKRKISPHKSPKKKKRKKNHRHSHSHTLPFTHNTTNSFNASEIMNSDPMSLDFNLVTVPDNILNDVKSIVANNHSQILMTNSNNSSMEPSLAPTTLKNESHIKVKDEKDKIKVETLECKLCHQAFDTQNNLDSHMGSAHSFQCDLCTKSFEKRIDLKRHQRLHEGIKVYECKICYKTYRSPATLHNHMRLHAVINLYTCKTCNKGFTQSHHLKRHLRIHTGVTPFRCRFCERPFKHNTSCKRHERTVHKDVYRPETPGDTIRNPKCNEAKVSISNVKRDEEMDGNEISSESETEERDVSS